MSTTSTRLPSITTDQLAEMLRARRGSTFVTFTALTSPEGRKHPAGKLRKLVRVNATVGAYYDRALLKATGEQANEERAWGEHNDSCLVEKTDPRTGAKSYYLPAQNPRTGKPLYLIEEEDGRMHMIPTEQAKLYLRQRPEPAVVYKDYKLNSLTSVAIGGHRYRIRRSS